MQGALPLKQAWFAALLSVLWIGPPCLAAAVEPPAKIRKAGAVVYCTELAFPPWEMIDPATQKPAGFDIDLGAAVAREMGVGSEHKNIAFDGLIPALEAHQCDAIISGLYDKPERRKIVDFALYAVTGTSVIVKAGSDLKVAGLADLAGKKVAVGVGTAGETEMTAANQNLAGKGKAIDIVAMQSSSGAFQPLSAGLVQAYVGSTDQAAYYNKLRPGLVKLAGPPLFQLKTGIATLRDDKELHAAFEDALRKVRADGEYDKILEKWGFADLALK